MLPMPPILGYILFFILASLGSIIGVFTGWLIRRKKLRPKMAVVNGLSGARRLRPGSVLVAAKLLSRRKICGRPVGVQESDRIRRLPMGVWHSWRCVLALGSSRVY
jgi:hypothetical protein